MRIRSCKGFLVSSSVDATQQGGFVVSSAGVVGMQYPVYAPRSCGLGGVAWRGVSAIASVSSHSAGLRVQDVSLRGPTVYEQCPANSNDDQRDCRRT